jgi:AhpC/TSA family
MSQIARSRGVVGQSLWILGLVALALAEGVWCGNAVADDPAAEKQAAFELDFALLDTAGGAHSLRPGPERDALVCIFLSTECPIANGYIPELNRQYAGLQQGTAHVAFYGVISDRSITRAAAARHSADFKIEFPVLFDASGSLARALKPTHTPEAFVIDARGRLAYRGRIDDVHADLGKRRSAPTERTLADAVAAVVAGRAPPQAFAEPVGCLYEPLQNPDLAGKVVYNRDIAPILQANCMNCHRDGEVAPFPLVSYSDASKRARQIARVTASRFMPPWKPEPGFGHFVDERRLSERELSLVADWANSGAPEGAAAD